MALADVEFLKVRDRQYGASWKLSGGRSAWYMAVRKIDRLREMMRRPEPPAGFSILNVVELIEDYFSAPKPEPSCSRLNAAAFVEHLLVDSIAEDVFAQIEDEPDGRDGTVLAEIRDLRRYLLLIEAEMVARGVVAQPAAVGPVTLNGETLVKENGEPLMAGDVRTGEEVTVFLSEPVPVEDSNRHADRAARPLLPLFWSHQNVVTFFEPEERDFFVASGQLQYRLPEFVPLGREIPDQFKPDYVVLAAGDRTLDRRRLSRDDLYQLPRYAVELNSKEYNDLPAEQQQLYRWNSDNPKWVMVTWMQRWWGQEPG